MLIDSSSSRIKYNDCSKKMQINLARGFTLAEMVVVTGIFLLLSGVSVSVYNNFRSRNTLDVTTNSIVQALRHAQINSEQVQNDAAWGTAIFADKVVVFQGASYATRISSLDQIFTFPSGISITGLSEIVFQKTTGWSNNIGTTTITNDKGEIKDIYINSKGTIVY